MEVHGSAFIKVSDEKYGKIQLQLKKNENRAVQIQVNTLLTPLHTANFYAHFICSWLTTTYKETFFPKFSRFSVAFASKGMSVFLHDKHFVIIMNCF